MNGRAMPIPDSAEQWRRLSSDVGRLVARRLPTRADVDDVVQEVLLRVWRGGRDLRSEERFSGWLSRIAYTAAADHMRSRQRHPVAIGQAGPEQASESDEPQPDARMLIAAVLRPFVDNLAELYREAVTLSELEGLSHPVIAQRLGLSVSGVKSRVQRGRELLRQMLERCCQIALDARGAPMGCELKPDADVPPGCCSNGCAPDPPVIDEPPR
jgi:RNA polymerase sigma-70 factor (ECF subfamily)